MNTPTTSEAIMSTGRGKPAHRLNPVWKVGLAIQLVAAGRAIMYYRANPGG